MKATTKIVKKLNIVEEYVNYVNMPEDGLDCLSRRSKSCVVNDALLGTEVLRVSVGYRRTGCKLVCLVIEKREERTMV